MMPKGYLKKVERAYKSLYRHSVSRWTIDRFFKGRSYTQELHAAVLSVASTQQVLLHKTEEVINA